MLVVYLGPNGLFYRLLTFLLYNVLIVSARVVSERTDDGTIVEYEGQKNVEEAIWSNIHDERFYAAEKSPICQDMLRGEFVYQADTPAIRRVLDGTYNYTEDFDPPNKEL